MYKTCALISLAVLQSFIIVSCDAAGANRAGQARDTNLGVSDFQCPSGTVVYPHPQCNLYYTCYGGQPTYLWQCRDDLLFDLVYNGCNWADQTYCGNRTRPDQVGTDSPTSSVPTVTVPIQTTLKPFTCPEDGFFASDNTRCIANFYTCLDGFPFATNCPSYGVFEPLGRKCVSPSSSACKNGNPSTSSVATSTTSPAINLSTTQSSSVVPVTTSRTSTAGSNTTPSSGSFVCPSNGNFADPTSCSHYYTCDNGTSYRMICPGGLVFNPNTGVCDWPSSVPGCNGKQ